MIHLFEFHARDGGALLARYADTTVTVTDTGNTVWQPADFEDFDVPGTDAGLNDDALKIVFVDRTKAYRAVFLPVPLDIRCDYYTVAVNALTPVHVGRAYVSHMREVGMLTALTLEGPMRKSTSEGQYLALPEFDEPGDNHHQWANEARTGAWSGTVVGGD